MTQPLLALEALPMLAHIPAAHGALVSPVQVSGATIFDVVVSVIVITDAGG